MKLTQFSEYALRVLIYLTLQPEKKVSIKQIAEFYSLSKDHLVKIVHHLTRLGYVKTTRGHGGGIQLGCDPQNVTIGEVVRQMEPSFHIAECFDAVSNQCEVTPVCNLHPILNEALDAFLNVLDQYTLDQMVLDKEESLEHITFQ